MTPAKISPTQIAAAGLAGVLVLLVAVLVHLRRQVEEAEREAARLVADVAVEREKEAMLTRQSAEVELATGSRMDAVTRFVPAPVIQPMPRRFAENREWARAYYRPFLRVQFARLYAEAGLPPDQIAQLEEMLLPLGESNGMMYLLGCYSEDPTQNSLLRHAPGAGLIAEVAELFGSEAGARFEAALQTHEVYAAVDDLAVKLMYAGAPLDSASRRNLAALLLDAGSHIRQHRRLRLPELDWDLVQQRAPGLFSGAQLRMVESLRAKALFDREYERVSGWVPLAEMTP